MYEEFYKKRYEAVRAVAGELMVRLEALEQEIDYKKLYQMFNNDGYELYCTAEKMTGINLSNSFPIEECRGEFETANGYELLSWIIKAKFGCINWSYKEGTPYETIESVSFEGKEKEINQFYKQIYKQTMHELLGCK